MLVNSLKLMLRGERERKGEIWGRKEVEGERERWGKEGSEKKKD